jgi:hypothetical protein
MNYDRQKQPTKMDQNATTNIDQDVANSRNIKYQNSQQEVKQYIYDTLQQKFSTLLPSKYGSGESIDLKSVELMDMLKDGEVLCRLGSLLSIPTNPTTKFKNSKIPFIQMENISFFLSLCELIDLPHDEIFQTVDLFESKDPYQVIVTLMSFSRIANSIDSTSFPKVIGPKTVKIKPPVPVKPFKLRS